MKQVCGFLNYHLIKFHVEKRMLKWALTYNLMEAKTGTIILESNLITSQRYSAYTCCITHVLTHPHPSMHTHAYPGTAINIHTELHFQEFILQYHHGSG